MSENRVYPRAAVIVPTWIRWGRESYKRTVAFDLSAQGAKLAAATPLQTGTALDLELQIQPDWRVKAEGTVQWCRPEAGGDYYEVGVSLRLPAGQRTQLGPYIQRARKAQSVGA